MSGFLFTLLIRDNIKSSWQPMFSDREHEIVRLKVVAHLAGGTSPDYLRIIRTPDDQLAIDLHIAELNDQLIIPVQVIYPPAPPAAAPPAVVPPAPPAVVPPAVKEHNMYRYEYGKRWDARVPRNDIRQLVSRIHVGTSEAEIAEDIRKRCNAPGYTATIIRQSVAYALECHKRNRELYCYVMQH